MSVVGLVAKCKCGKKNRVMSSLNEKECRKELRRLGWEWRVIARHKEEFICAECQQRTISDGSPSGNKKEVGQDSHESLKSVRSNGRSQKRNRGDGGPKYGHTDNSGRLISPPKTGLELSGFESGLRAAVTAASASPRGEQ
jgi:hypothetical protein